MKQNIVNHISTKDNINNLKGQYLASPGNLLPFTYLSPNVQENARH